MIQFIVAKVLVTILSLLCVMIPGKFSLLWVLCSFALCVAFVSHIPRSRRTSLFMLVPLLVTIAGLQTVSGFLAHGVYAPSIAESSLKIIFTGCIVIGARFFIGREALKLLASRAPFSAGLFFLVFARTLAIFSRLNRMIVFQLQSRLNLKSAEKYYIPKYYTTALLFNQFHAMHRHHSGVLSRSFSEIPEVEIFTEISFRERTTIFAVIIITAIYIIAGSQGAP